MIPVPRSTYRRSTDSSDRSSFQPVLEISRLRGISGSQLQLCLRREEAGRPNIDNEEQDEDQDGDQAEDDFGSKQLFDDISLEDQDLVIHSSLLTVEATQINDQEMTVNITLPGTDTDVETLVGALNKENDLTSEAAKGSVFATSLVSDNKSDQLPVRFMVPLSIKGCPNNGFINALADTGSTENIISEHILDRPGVSDKLQRVEITPIRLKTFDGIEFKSNEYVTLNLSVLLDQGEEGGRDIVEDFYILPAKVMGDQDGLLSYRSLFNQGILCFTPFGRKIYESQTRYADWPVMHINSRPGGGEPSVQFPRPA